MRGHAVSNPGKPSILYVLEATNAGVGRFTIDSLMNINLDVFNVSFVYSMKRSDERFREELPRIAARGIRTFEIPMAREINPTEDARAFLQLRKFLAQHRFDIVHGHSSKGGFISRLSARSIRRRPLTVYTPHAVAIPLNPMYGWLERFAGLFTDGLIAVSQSERKELEGYRLVPREKLHYLTAAIDAKAYASYQPTGEVRKWLRLSPETVLIGGAGRLAPQKDPLTFVAVASQVLRHAPDAHFVWMGDGELLNAAVERATSLGIRERVTFPGYCADMKEWLSSLDVFLLTSVYESFGYVTCESMALGKPVVATRVAGSSELVTHGDTGYLAEPRNIEEITRFVSALVSNRDLRTRMGAAGQRKALDAYDLPRMMHELETLYWRMLSLSSARYARAPIRTTVETAGDVGAITRVSERNS